MHSKFISELFHVYDVLEYGFIFGLNWNEKLIIKIVISWHPYIQWLLKKLYTYTYIHIHICTYTYIYTQTEREDC